MEHTKNIHDKGNDSKLRTLAGKQMPFDVPEDYFDQLPGKILDRIHEKPVQRIGFRHPLVQLATAASILILISFSAVQLLFNPAAEVNTIESYSINELYQYNLDNMAELEDSYLISFLEDENIAFSDPLEEVDEISEEAIMEYLLAENHIEYYFINEY
jgi:hypothetical protein